ncbi:MAG: hypothetical protein JO168_27970 [Solirubrobacterales bacterium]|nr:hypothetical protein [Solirubrobacterales bacterium]MBV9716808.1 hypothetical protein [Solirubrobacterales bacterium]
MSHVFDVVVREVPGIRGTELAPEIVERLPVSAPPAPWRLRASGCLWVAPAPRCAGAALQKGIAGRPLAVGGMFVAYEETPVGPYNEIIGFVALRRRWSVAGHIPFIAVDSAASVVGGRVNWLLPKTVATFSGHAVRERAVRARHDEWEVSAQARALGPLLVARSSLTLVQAGADGREGRARGRVRVRLRPALVRVRTGGVPELTGWLRSGRYPGLVIERFEGELGPRIG